MKKFILAALAISAFSLANANEKEAPLWLRNTAISPDGSTIAFTYHGNIFTIPYAGGLAKQITSNSSYDTNPVWSPDGKHIAFDSNREGSVEIFIVNAEGGSPKRLTRDALKKKTLTFLNDSTIIYSSKSQPGKDAAQGGFSGQTYSININGGRPIMYASTDMQAASADKNGRLLYQDKKGYEDPFRKHERSSGTSDIWLLENDTYTKLTDFNGHDLNPSWAADGSFFYVSEQDGTLNAYKRTLDGKEVQLTKMERHPVRSLSASADGKLTFSWNGEIYTLAPGGTPQKVNVEIICDDYNPDLTKGYRTSGATAMAVSPSGDEVAFILRGDVYVTSVEYETTKRITNTDGQERNVAFSPDGRTLVYDSERDGLWQIFTSSIKNKDEELFTYATEIEEKPLYSSNLPAQQPSFSPDGKKVAFLEDRTTLRVIDVKSKETTTALDGKYNYSYSDGDIPFQWSPDSKWLLISYIGVGGWNNNDIAIVSADGKEVIDLTESGYADNGPRWALGGKGVIYSSGRNGYRSHGSWGEELDVYLMVLDGEAWDDFNMSEEDLEIKKANSKDKKKEKDEDEDDSDDKKDKKDKKIEPLKFDFKNRKYRTIRLTPRSSNLVDYWLSPKGDNLYFISPSMEGGANLMVRDMKEGDTRTLLKKVGSAEIIPDADGKNIYLLTDRGMKKVAIPSGSEETIEFNAPYIRQPSAEREYIFNHAVAQVANKFYDKDLHGVDWEGYANDYRRFLPWINNNYDFAEALSELLGELNASHTGSRYYGPGAKHPVAVLGAFFDQNYEGDGLKIAEIIARGPLASDNAKANVGDIIVSIDGEDIKAGEDYFHMLEDKADKNVRIGIKNKKGKVEYSIIKPISQSDLSDLLYQRWVENNEAVVDSISGGRIAYVHVQGMDSESFREVYSKLLGKYRNCDAVVVDTRWNGGGWLHNDIALLLNGKEYVRYSPRGKYIGSDPFSQWTKPSAMLINESNYSDAHGTPYTYKTLGIGKLVGAPVPGTMTAVWWEYQIDPTLLFGIPQVTSLDRNGKPLENQQLNPDIEVYNNPADVEKGIDNQLIQAVKSLMEETSGK